MIKGWGIIGTVLYRLFIGVIISVLVLIVVNRFVFGLFFVPSNSMEQTISAGDYIIANKLYTGPRLKWNGEILKIPGYSSVKQGDVILFELLNGTADDSTFKADSLPLTVFIKRCVALPGDTVYIINGMLYVNGKLFGDAECAINRYMVWGNPDSITKAFSCIKNSYGAPALRGKRKVGLFLSNRQKEMLLRMGCCDSITRALLPTAPKIIFPEDFDWSFDAYGPIVVPQMGMKIKMDTLNRLLYNSTIAKHEQILDSVKSDSDTNAFVFGQNYYFMMGDNRYQSNDSRAWGFVPENALVGVAMLKIGKNGVTKFK